MHQVAGSPAEQVGEQVERSAKGERASGGAVDVLAKSSLGPSDTRDQARRRVS